MSYQAYKRQDCTDDTLGLRSILIKLFKSLTDQFIVPVMWGNAYGGKGLAGVRWTGRETPPIPRDGRGVSTKLWSITQRAREDPTCKFTSLAHLLTADFLKECFRELKKDKAPGIDGVVL